MTTTLTDHLTKVWQELKDAVRTEDWGATQQSFHRMEKIQQVNEEFAKKLEEIGDFGGPPPFDESKTVVQFNGVRRGTIRPTELRIDLDRIPISLNNQIVVATGNWILKNRPGSIPVIKNFVHRDNSGFSPSAQTKRLNDGSYIEVGDSQRTLVVKARKLLDSCGYLNTKLQVQLEDGSIIE
jgi:hypothetical protein